MGGYSGFLPENFRKNTLESNSSNMIYKSDWEFSAIYGAEFSARNSNPANDVYLISLAKKINNHYFYFRYTPAFNKSFLISVGNNIKIDSTSTSLNTTLNYSEKFGFGYSYLIKKNFSVGVSLRYFEEEMKEDVFNFFIGDTSILSTVTEISKKKFWRTDFGMNYSPIENLNFSLSSKNLLLLNENGNLNNHSYEMRLKKGMIFGFDSKLSDNFAMKLFWETGNSFLFGSFYSFQILGGKVIAGLNITHDQTQNPFVNSVMPTISLSSNLYNLALSYVHYLKNENVNRLTDFSTRGITNIVNNRFSYDKLLLSLNFALSFKHEKQVEYSKIELVKDIYPTLSEEYVNSPFAIAEVKNLTDKKITVRPVSFIEGINKENVYSPNVEILPNEIAEVKFYTLIDESKQYDKRKIENAQFMIYTSESEFDDKLEKPLLIHTKNNWDGKVVNLRYFVYSDFNFSLNFATQTLKKNAKPDSNRVLKTFNAIKTLHAEFIKNMTYFSDPRTSFEYVQFPKETLERKGGDCDDLSVAFASLLESVGIETAFVDYSSADGVSHVNLLINTKLNSEFSELITLNDKKFYVRTNQNGEDEIWIPLESTNFESFEKAWEIAADKFYTEAIENFGLQKGNVSIIDIY
ncbi:MAG: hypothetical protein Fur0015_13500 [Ignavibacteriales bacterium]